MAESKFTDEVVEVMNAAAPLDWAKAQEIGARFDIKPRAVVASAIRQGIEYKRKERVTKSGAKVVSKADLVKGIAAKFDLDLDALDGLEKATKTSLAALLG
jgi:hypothetical protein